MKFYSEELKKFYESAEECEKAEKEAAKAREEAKAKQEALVAARKERAKEVEDALKAAIEAKKNYDKLLRSFCKDYGTFHFSMRDNDFFPSLFDLLNF